MGCYLFSRCLPSTRRCMRSLPAFRAVPSPRVPRRISAPSFSAPNVSLSLVPLLSPIPSPFYCLLVSLSFVPIACHLRRLSAARDVIGKRSFSHIAPCLRRRLSLPCSYQLIAHARAYRPSVAASSRPTTSPDAVHSASPSRYGVGSISSSHGSARGGEGKPDMPDWNELARFPMMPA